MTTEQLVRLSSLKPLARCPLDGSLLRPETIQQAERSANGTTLWTLSQRCMMCGWSQSASNVKMGV